VKRGEEELEDLIDGGDNFANDSLQTGNNCFLESIEVSKKCQNCRGY